MLPSSLYGFLGAGLLGAALAGGGVWAVQGWRHDAAIEKVKADSAKADADAYKTALDDMVAAGKVISEKASEGRADVTALSAKLDAIRKDVKNVKPLPVDCKPDASRVSRLTATAAAANEAIAGSVSGRAVPAVRPAGD